MQVELIELLIALGTGGGANGGPDHAKRLGLFFVAGDKVAGLFAEGFSGARALDVARIGGGGAGVLVAEGLRALLVLRPLAWVGGLAGAVGLDGEVIVLVACGVLACLGEGVRGGQQQGEEEGEGAHGGSLAGGGVSNNPTRDAKHSAAPNPPQWEGALRTNYFPGEIF